MRTVRIVIWILVGLTASATCACSPDVSPTAQIEPEDPSKTAAPIPPEEREAALKIVDRAVKAHGGAEALARIHNLDRDGEGTSPAPFTDHTLFALPDRARMQLDLGPQKDRTVFVINGKKGWIWQAVNKQTRDMTPIEVEEFRQDLHVMWLTTLLPLKSDAVKIGTLPDDDVENRPVVVVRVLAPDHPEVRLSFDKESGLLVKAERKAFEKGSDILKKHFYTDYKAFEGVMMPTHELILTNGKIFCKVTFTTWKFPAKVDDKEFTRP